MTTDKGTTTTSNNPLEQFVLLAKSAKGAAAVELIKQVLEAPGVHVFGELLDMPNVLELENGPHSNYLQVLHLFAYGTYRQYLDNRTHLPELSPAQKKKLQHLTIVTLATKTKILYNDTCFTAQALVRLYVDLNEKNLDMVEMAGRAETEPRFSDVAATFELLAGQIVDVRHLLEVRPVQKRQQESFDRTLKCIAHLIYLLVETAHTLSQREEVHHMVSKLIRHNVRSASTGDTLLHLCVSCLNTIKSSYFTDENQLIFPNLDVIRLLLECGARVNARNESRSTPLHIAGTPYNFHTDLVQLLLDYGAHIDQPNKSGECPGSLIARNPLNTINLMDHVSLRCLAATSVCKYKIPYKGQIPVTLEAFVRFHE